MLKSVGEVVLRSDVVPGAAEDAVVLKLTDTLLVSGVMVLVVPIAAPAEVCVNLAVVADIVAVAADVAFKSSPPPTTPPPVLDSVEADDWLPLSPDEMPTAAPTTKRMTKSAPSTYHVVREQQPGWQYFRLDSL